MTDSNQLVLVSGATGKQGGAVARKLLQHGWTVRAMTRKPDSPAARALAAKGAQIVEADLDDATSLARALEGAWGTLAIQNTWEAGVEREEEQGKRFAHVAKDVGVSHFVYHSVQSAQRKTGIPHFDNKWRIEETVRSLGFDSHVIIRPVLFMYKLLAPDTRAAILSGTYALAIRPETTLQMIAVRDIAEYGLQAFDRAAALNRREIDIAGDALTGPEIARILGEISGHPVQFQSTPKEQVRAWSEDAAIMFEWFDAVGYNVDIARTSAEFGVRPTMFREWAEAHHRDFGGEHKIPERSERERAQSRDPRVVQ
jgi:uncharacterized protein YbjT (DUF2867 family)